jgi:hypothetical protein
MSDGFVGLKSAFLSMSGGAGQLHSSFSVWVKIKNVVYYKDVRAHYRGPAGGIWQDSPLTWKANYGSYDLFALEQAPDFGSNPFVEFAISVASGGGTYWDNNSFANYSLAPFTTALTGDKNVTLNSASLVFGGTAGSSYITGISGEIFVNNLSYHKKVGIRHSNDGWISYLDIDARYDKSLGGSLESWLFGRNTTPQGFGRGEFAIYYQNRETGQYYWDNNFGQNYDVRNRYNLE